VLYSFRNDDILGFGGSRNSYAKIFGDSYEGFYAMRSPYKTSKTKGDASKSGVLHGSEVVDWIGDDHGIAKKKMERILIEVACSCFQELGR